MKLDGEIDLEELIADLEKAGRKGEFNKEEQRLAEELVDKYLDEEFTEPDKK